MSLATFLCPFLNLRESAHQKHDSLFFGVRPHLTVFKTKDASIIDKIAIIPIRYSTKMLSFVELACLNQKKHLKSEPHI